MKRRHIPLTTFCINHLQNVLFLDYDSKVTGLHIDSVLRHELLSGERRVIQTVESSQRSEGGGYRPRIGDRRHLRVQGRLTWRDAAGALRFVSVVTRDVSDVDAFVECQVPTSIPLYRLVHFQIERTGREHAELPPALQHGTVLSAIYRVGPFRAATGTPHGYALRLLIEPGAGANTARKRRVLAVAN